MNRSVLFASSVCFLSHKTVGAIAGKDGCGLKAIKCGGNKDVYSDMVEVAASRVNNHFDKVLALHNGVALVNVVQGKFVRSEAAFQVNKFIIVLS